MGRKRSKSEDARHQPEPQLKPQEGTKVEQTIHTCHCGTRALNTLTSATELVPHKVPDGSRPCNY